MRAICSAEWYVFLLLLQAKEGGSAVYQGGFDAAARLDQEYAQKEKERKLQAYSDQQRKEHQNVKKDELIPKAQNVIGKAYIYGADSITYRTETR